MGFAVCCQNHCRVEEETWREATQSPAAPRQTERGEDPQAAETDGKGMFFPLAPVDTAHFSRPQGKILFAYMLKESLNSHFSRSVWFTPGETHTSDAGNSVENVCFYSAPFLSKEWDHWVFIYPHLKLTTNMCYSHPWQVWLLQTVLSGFDLIVSFFFSLRKRRLGSGKRSCWIRGGRWWRRSCFMLNSSESFNSRPSWRKHRKRRRRSEVLNLRG